MSTSYPKRTSIMKLFSSAKQLKRAMKPLISLLLVFASHCEFTDLNRELKLAVIQNCTSKRLRRYALREDDMTIDKILAKARALENSEKQAKGMEDTAAQSTATPSETIRHVGRSQHSPGQFRNLTLQRTSTQCCQCGLSWPHTKNPCPASVVNGIISPKCA